LVAAIVACCWLLAAVVGALAHNGAEDVGWVYLSGSSQSDGEATIQVDISEQALCDRLDPLELEGVRAELDVTGTLARVEPCRFAGEISLPEAGRWMIAARFAYDNRQAEVWMPVGVTDTPQQFERGDWLHAVGSADSGWSTGRMALLIGLGLAVGTLATVAFRRLRPAEVGG
jgi:hypothetical protein